MPGLGWIPERRDLAVPRAAALTMSLAPVECYDLVDRSLTYPVYDQAHTSSCVAQAIAAAMRVLSQVEPSRRWLYRLAREYDRDLADDGTRISSVCRVVRDLGWCAESHMPWDPLRIDEPPTLIARRNAADQVAAVREHAILEDGERKCELTRAALATGYPIVFGAMVDAAYLSLSTWVPVSFDGLKIGGHAQVALGYCADGVVVQNSWGGDWGLGGLALLSWQCWRDQCEDLRVIVECQRPSS